MIHLHAKRKRTPNVCAAAALVFPMLIVCMGSVVYADFIMSAQLICIANVNSGSVVIEITGWKIKSTNTIDANGNTVIFGDELKIENVTEDGNKVVGLNITANPIGPGWYLNLTVDIHNTIDSIPVRISRTIYYWSNDVNDWVETDENGLLDLFKLRYFDEWYNATTGEPIPSIETLDIWPCRTVTILESLRFDGQDYPQLQGQTFCFMVVITATYPKTRG